MNAYQRDTIYTLLLNYMKCSMKKIVFAIFALSLVNLSEAKPIFTGQNYSGEYICKGINEKVGEYEVHLTLKLNRVSSYGKFGTYDFDTETENSVVYHGQAVTEGTLLAMTFKISDSKSSEFSTGLAEIKKIGAGRWGFNNHYYEPDDNGGNYGSEFCAMKKLTQSKKSRKIEPS